MGSAMTLEEVRYVASQILRGKILIGHGLENDLTVIGLNHPICDIRDTATYNPYMQIISRCEGAQVYRPRKLKDLTWEILGAKIQVIGTSHSPVEDAMATMELYKAARVDWEMHMTKQVKLHLENCLPPPPQQRSRRYFSKWTPTTEEHAVMVQVAQK